MSAIPEANGNGALKIRQLADDAKLVGRI